MIRRNLLTACRRALLLILMLAACAAAAEAGSPPVAVSDTYNFHTAGGSAAPGFLANDYDPDGGKVYLRTEPGCSWLGHGTFCMGPYRDGAFSYTPGGEPGTDTFTYWIDDYHDGWAPGTITFNVINGAPTAGADSFHAHGQSYWPAPGVLGNDSDPDGDRLTLRSLQGNCLNCWIVGSYGWGALSSDGGFSYAPSPGAVGTDVFYYTVCDNLNKCTNANITVHVGNTAPTATAQVYRVPAAGRLDISAPGLLAGASDADGDPVTVGGAGPPGYGASGPTFHGGWIGRTNDGAFTYFADPSGATGADWFTYQVCDNFGACSEATVYFYVYDDCGCRDCAGAYLGGGGSSGGTEDPVNLFTGRETHTPAPDLLVYNPSGPPVSWQRSYFGEQGMRGYWSPGLSLGWVHNYDLRIEGPAAAGTWGSLRLIRPNGGTDTLTPVLNGAGQPTGEFTTQAGRALLARGVTGAASGVWQSITVTGEDQVQWTFTSFSGGTYVPTRISNRVGRGIDLTWRADRALSQVRDTTSGAVLLSLTYDGRGRLSAATDAYGRQVSYAFSAPTGSDPGKLLSVSQAVTAGTNNPPLRYGFTYSLAAHQQLTGITVPSATGSGAAAATIIYGADAKVASMVDANGNRREIIYGAGTTQVQAKDAAGNAVAAWTQRFDASGRDAGVTDANNASTLVEYNDPQNPYKPTRVVGRDGKATTFTYDQFGNTLTVTTPRGVTTVYTYDYTSFTLGRLESVKEGTKPETALAYFEPSGLVQSVTGPSPTGTGTATTSYTYDALGNVLTATGPGNNAAGQITTTYGYTADGTYTQPSRAGQPLTVTDNLGHTTHLRYDAQGRATSRADALGHETNVAYNLAGQAVEVTYPATGETGAGRSRVVTSYLYPAGPANSVTLYDESGAQRRQVSYGYGAEGELLSVSGSTEPASYTYDALYRPKTLKDGKNNTTTYAYDGVGNLSGVQMPGGESVQFPLHDPAGRVLRRVDGNGVTTDYVYDDPGGLLTDIRYPATPALNVHFGYDGFGRRNSMTDSTGSHGYVFGDLGELKSVSTTYTGLPAQTISYTYNPDGSRHTMATPAGTFTYGYDGGGRASSLTNPYGETTGWTYYVNDWLNTQTLANGAETTHTFNALGQLSGLLNKTGGGVTLSDFGQIGHDGARNRTSVTASVPGAPALSGTASYQYDGKDQLLREQTTRGGGFTDDFDYDLAGNLTTFRGVTKTYNANNQQTGASFTHDGNGNPTAYNGAGLSFDPENRLTAYGAALTAGYRGDGLRAWKQGAAGGRTYFLYDGSLAVVELDAAGSVVAANTFGAAGLVSRRAGAQSTFYTFDPQGSVAQRLDAGGAVLSSHLYTAHGSPLTTPAVGEPFGYGGRWGYYTDSETGLQLLTNRYYDPQAGRFVTRDPAGYAGGINLYAYVRNGPLTYSDPSGLDGWGNDFAGWLDDQIGDAQRYLQPDVQNWVGNGAVATGADLARGMADMFRVGSGLGHALYDCGENGYGRAAAVAQDIARAAALFQTLAGPFAGRGGSPAGDVPASTPVGRSGKPLQVAIPDEPPINAPGNVYGRDYSGHAFDQMQGRGIPPSAVENTIQTGQPFPGNKPNTTGYYDPVNNLTAITDSASGRVVTVRQGRP
jgi:RHS repeat-associated protein